MNLSFHKELVPKIMSGSKIHTIREDKHNRWKVGMPIDFCTGLRTKNYQKFFPKNRTCKGTQIIRIRWMGILRVPYVWIDNKPIGMDVIQTLAINDGLGNYSKFFEWFNKDFNGKVIHWTNFRY